MLFERRRQEHDLPLDLDGSALHLDPMSREDDVAHVHSDRLAPAEAAVRQDEDEGLVRVVGSSLGETDDFGYNIVKDPVHVHDFHATVMHLLGLDHEKLIYKHLGRRYRLTDVAGKVVKDIIA